MAQSRLFERVSRFVARGRRGVPLFAPPAADPVIAAEYSPAEADTVTTGHLRTLGTFGGVFTPSFLTIIGVIMYLRFSWVLANAGLVHTIGIVVIANAITLITALSVAGIASNEQMETGGAYFMVSRVLGYQAGGGIGIPLFFSQALSIALYVIGFAEALTAIVPHWSIQIVAIVTMFALTLLGLIGARYMVMLQYVILVVILASFISIAAGFNPLFLTQNIAPAYGEGFAFWGVFAVFFPAVTGILAGVSMSGDLKNPARSIPRGTLLAVAAGFFVYLLVPIMLSFTVARESLRFSTALRDASRWPLLVTGGVMAATLSSAIGSLMAAPRTLQALGIDAVVPRFLGRGVGKTAEPLLATGIALGFALMAILLGSLNQVAEVLTMFFLTTYAVLNLSAGMEQMVNNPSFRPAVRIPWWVSFAGFLGCVAVMFLINVLATVVAILAVTVIFFWLQTRTTRLRASGKVLVQHGGLWEGFWTAVFFRVARKLALSRTGSGKNWRPFIQLFASDVDAHSELMDTAAVLTRHGGALAMYAMLARSTTTDLLGRRQTVSRELSAFTQQLAQPNVFNHVVETDSFHEGVVVAAQAAAFAAGEYNTVMLGLPALSRQDHDYTRMLINLSRINRNILLLKKGPRPWGSLRGPITVWWGGQENNVRLMLILAYLLQSASVSPPRIQLKTIVSDASQTTDVAQRLRDSVRELRMPADTAVVVNSDGAPIPEVLARESRDAVLTVLGMAKPDQSMIRSYLPGLRNTTAGLGTTLLVMNNIPEIRYV